MIVCRNRRRGFTLMELIGVMGGLGVALMVGTLLLYGIMGLQRFSGGHHQRVARHAALAERFRDDVRAAADFVMQDATHLSLKMPDGREIVYGFNDNEIERTVGDTRQMFPLTTTTATVTFLQPTGSTALITLMLTRHEKNRTAIAFEYTAQLGGGHR